MGGRGQIALLVDLDGRFSLLRLSAMLELHCQGDSETVSVMVHFYKFKITVIIGFTCFTFNMLTNYYLTFFKVRLDLPCL